MSYESPGASVFGAVPAQGRSAPSGLPPLRWIFSPRSQSVPFRAKSLSTMQALGICFRPVLLTRSGQELWAFYGLPSNYGYFAMV
ncbi:hypothetical protein [Streptomyces sp. NPDC058542]|uniref:hypothetical protein n=1 Tax=Streptomyces sp. NPDC058542 TaxID=3346543 RepID=UPI0036544E97